MVVNVNNSCELRHDVKAKIPTKFQSDYLV
jgi:hypothetical protein